MTSTPTVAENPLQKALASLDAGDALTAETTLGELLAAEPENPRALLVLGMIRNQQGALTEAESCYRRSIAGDAGQTQTYHCLGNLLRSQRRLAEAVAAQREAVRLNPGYAAAHLGLALALSDSGNHEQAEKSCRSALRIQPNYLAAKQLLSCELNDLDRPGEAEALLRTTLSLGVRDSRVAAALENNLGIALKQQDRFEEALKFFDMARAKVPDLPSVDYNRAGTFQQLGRLEEALQSYLRAVAADPGNPDALAGAGLMSAQLGDFAMAKEYAGRALDIAAGHDLALIVAAMVSIENGDIGSADDKLQRVIESARHTRNGHASFALGYAADVFDRRGLAPQAFAIYSASNAQRRDLSTPAYENNRASADVARLTEHFQTAGKWQAAAAGAGLDSPAAAHVFLLGFMRSGTTLLATILASNKDVVTIDEIELLTEPARRFLLEDSGLRSLPGLQDNEARLWRAEYWRSVQASGRDVRGKVFVDKMPFNSIRLPLIARLFPAAKILFVLRDPRDVVLSCFRRRFNIGPYSFEFLDLLDCARFYVSVMTLAESYRRILPLNILEHRYEDMIADFDKSIRAVCEFSGIAWNVSMRNFSEAANMIDRRSASATQVRQELYKEASGHWRLYKNELAPVLPILQPWVERYGYPAD